MKSAPSTIRKSIWMGGRPGRRRTWGPCSQLLEGADFYSQNGNDNFVLIHKVISIKWDNTPEALSTLPDPQQTPHRREQVLPARYGCFLADFPPAPTLSYLYFSNAFVSMWRGIRAFLCRDVSFSSENTQNEGNANALWEGSLCINGSPTVAKTKRTLAGRVTVFLGLLGLRVNSHG